MKKIFAALLLAMMLCGCSSTNANVKKEEPVEVSRFMVVEKVAQWWVLADRETGVMYAVSRGGYNVGTFTLLVDADNKPLIYDGGMR